ncbi:MAG: hypothetical protein ABWX94_00145 [Candidatus Saccharimonadales bacterium]
MSEMFPVSTPEKSEILDDDARKFIVDGINYHFLEQISASSFTMTVDWLETNEANEKKLAHKKFDTGEVQILQISKRTVDGKRTSRKDKITEEEYEELLDASVLHLEKRRHELVYMQDNIPFSVKFDEFAGGKLCVVEVDASNEDDRQVFNPDDFPAKLTEVTGDLRYYGFRIAAIV